jgi:hypothetical protein
MLIELFFKISIIFRYKMLKRKASSDRNARYMNNTSHEARQSNVRVKKQIRTGKAALASITLEIGGKKIHLYNWSGYGAYSFVFRGSYKKNRDCTIKFVRAIDNENEGVLMKRASSFNELTRHFIDYYDHQLCRESDPCFVEHDGLKDKFKLAIIMKTYNDTAIKALFSGIIIDESVKKNIFAQIFLSTISFHSFLGLKHGDVKIENFLFYKKPKILPGYFCYIINYKGTSDRVGSSGSKGSRGSEGSRGSKGSSGNKKYYIYLKNIDYGIVIGDYGTASTVSDSKELLEDFLIIHESGINNDWISARNDKQDKVTVSNSSSYIDYITRFLEDYDLFGEVKELKDIPVVKTYTINIPPKLSTSIITGGNKTKGIKKAGISNKASN